MVTLDEFMILSPAAESKWGKLSRFHKELISFLFFESILPEYGGAIDLLPDQILGKAVIKRLGIDLGRGYMIVAIYREHCILLDFDVERALLEVDWAAPPS
jgi:hypothetical protein